MNNLYKMDNFPYAMLMYSLWLIDWLIDWLSQNMNYVIKYNTLLLPSFHFEWGHQTHNVVIIWPNHTAINHRSRCIPIALSTLVSPGMGTAFTGTALPPAWGTALLGWADSGCAGTARLGSWLLCSRAELGLAPGLQVNKVGVVIFSLENAMVRNLSC